MAKEVEEKGVCPCGKTIPPARRDFLKQEGLALMCVSCAQAAEAKNPNRKKAVMVPFKGADALEVSEWRGFLKAAEQ